MRSLKVIILCVLTTFSAHVAAQDIVVNPVVTVDLDRLVNETQIGQYLSFQMGERVSPVIEHSH